ncbi:MAG: MFS transporter [Verrucomicrobiota bacterium]|jgi:MFS family permease|nr:MFS transporter [Verrucomicrobiota bacterium]
MSNENNKSSADMFLFWGCFIALITTAFAFITRAFLVNTPALWPAAFNLDAVQGQELFNAGVWPFAISIIAFSLIIDKIGYKTAMIFSFVCYALYAILAFTAHGMVSGLEGEALAAAQTKAYNYLYGGSVILGLGNGTVEAFINPVVATMFKKEKTKWLNILHAGWPGGLVLGGLLTILLGAQAANDWRILIYLIAIPAVAFLFMLIKANFPVNERVEAGTSYKEMLSEFGVIGALIATGLIFGQLGEVLKWGSTVTLALIAVSTIAYGIYCKSIGRPILIFLCLIMMPLATTEIGTDSAITGIMTEPMQEAGWHPLWVLIYTSGIMMILRFFFAGQIVDLLTPIGLLMVSAGLAIVGLFFLSTAQGLAVIFIFATLYGFGKTFFWPTMLGVVSEQCPKGGALTLNAIAGIGMLTVGVVGGPLIGKMQEDSAKSAFEAAEYETISKKDTFLLGDYTAVDTKKVEALGEEKAKEINNKVKVAKQGALATITIFPIVMLICYIVLFIYFKGRGGYKTVELDGATGGDAAH